MNIFKNRSFVLLWSSMFFSMIGTFLLLLVLSAKFFVEFKSSTLAGSVFSIQWLPAILFMPVIGFLCSNFLPKKLLIFVEILSGFITLMIGVLYNYGYLLVFFLLFFRGFLEAVMKSSRMIALKYYIPTEMLEKASSIFNTSYFLGGAIGGLIGTFIINHFSILQIAIIDSITFGISAVLYFFLPKILEQDFIKKDPKPINSIFQFLDKGREVFKRHPDVFEFFIYIIITVAIFQSYHTVARTVIPLSKFNIGQSGVTLYQVVASSALLFGSFFVYRWLTNTKSFLSHPFVLIIITCFSMLLTIVSSNLVIGLLSYFLFIFLFEVTFIRCMNYIMINCSKDLLPQFIPFLNSCMMASMVINVFFIGKAIDLYSLDFLTTGFVIIAFVVTFVFYTKISRKKKLANTIK